MIMRLDGCPEGWKPVRYGKPSRGEHVVTTHGVIKWTLDDTVTSSFHLVVAEEKRSGVRSFRNASEFIEEMAADNWLINVETGALETVLLVDDDGVETVRGLVSYIDLLSRYEFADGRVCGRHEDQ